MVQALRMPMMGNTMETGLLAEWVVNEGDPVEPDQVVAVVESEKATADVVANREGTLARVDVEEGEEVPPGTLVGIVLGPDETIEDAPPPGSRVEPGDAGDPDAAAATAGTGEPEAAVERGGPDDDAALGSVEDTTAERVRAAPGARRLADVEGIDLDAIEGSGPDGVVLIADVEAHVADEDERVGADPDAGVEMEVPAAGGSRAFVPPSTRRLARELGVGIAGVEGTGSGGRVTESDVRRAAGLGGADGDDDERRRAPPSDRSGTGGIAGPPPRDPSRLGVTVAEERELSGVRRTVAERMSRSAREAPQVTLDRAVAVERAFETVEELSMAADGETGETGEAGDVEVGFVDLLVGAAVRALERHPEFNAWYEGETLRLIEEVNVAVAIDSEAGLLTPVLREAGKRTLDGIARERRRLTEAVLEGRHGMDDLQGGTFTVSNLGPLGVDSFDPILDPPQVAILGVGRVNDGTCRLSLTVDHRVVDGADAARFLDTLAEGVESPSVVVAERATAGTPAGGDEPASGGDDAPRTAVAEPASTSASTDRTVETAVASDLAERAREVAVAHDWPVPAFEVRLDEKRPTVAVDANGDASPATLRRLAYAACRESRYADTIAGLRDPEIELRSEDRRVASPTDERE